MHARQGRIIAQLRDKTQGDRFDRIAAVSSDSGHAPYGGRRNIGVRIDPDNAFNRIDGRYAVCAPAQGCLRRGTHAVHIGGQFREDRYFRAAPCRRRKPLHQLRHLADIRSQTAFRHIGTGEIQFNGVSAVLLAQARQPFPVFVILSHDGRQNELGGIFRLEPAENIHIFFYAVVGQLLNILEADDTSVITRDCRETGRSLVDIHGADGLERDAGPACFKGSGAHFISTAHNGG